jgi:hypothetical protein
MLASLLLVSLSIMPLLEASGEKKAVNTACKRALASGLELEVSVPEQCHVGSEIISTVKVTNKSNKPIDYTWHGSGDFRSYSQFRHFLVDIRDSGGKPVPRTRFGKMIADGGLDSKVVTYTLKPGESTGAIPFNLTRVFDLSISGEYSIGINSGVLFSLPGRLAVDSVRFSLME